MNLFVWMTNNIVYIIVFVIVYVIVYVFISYYYFFYILYMEINALSDNDSVFSFDDQWIDDYIDEDNHENIDEDNHENIDENIDENILDTITSDNLSEMIDISNNLCDTLCDSIKIYFLYVDKDEGNLNTMNSNVIKSIKSTYVTYHKSIKKSLILSLVKKYSMYENNPYTLLNILKYENLFTSKDLEKIISHPLNTNTNDIFDMSNNNFLTVYKKLQDIDINQSTLKILYPLSCIYFIFIKTITKKKYNVIPSLKIPYHDQKKNRKTRYLAKSLSIQNKSKKYKKQL